MTEYGTTDRAEREVLMKRRALSCAHAKFPLPPAPRRPFFSSSWLNTQPSTRRSVIFISVLLFVPGQTLHIWPFIDVFSAFQFCLPACLPA